MALKPQNQQPQQLQQAHVAVLSAAQSGGYNHIVAACRRRSSSQFTVLKTIMSRRNGPKLDLKLNLSPPRVNHHGRRVDSPSRSLTVSPASPPSSCVSLELNQQDECLRYSSSPEATSMMLVGCPRCLMYVMLAEEDPRCPKCKSTVLLDFVQENNNNNNTTTTTTGGRRAKRC